jgi:Flp pilus assembly protein TadD
LGSVALKKGKDDDALLAFENTVRYNPDDRAAHIEAANLLRRKGKPEAALQHLRKASKLEPRQPGTFYLLGCLLREQGAWKDAEKAIDEALALGAPKADCYRELDVIYRKLADEAGATHERERSSIP